ncbi:hypothetical protein BDK51DRAFT_27182 [Blyttiomyces helicus]|uniref:Uncharacterized protein n=1 Tax=Blyttiomyces helicus TaxID=388810 RepID=A0A4P9W7L9_9FUNG|nr:hypothetical protein BDK51DRAFT_27182 [Blyttiomyces helicus]|eukprot:RKO87375.1 hypothetical protein BDK51DRAFT_27182 [Blyttiomyces helicus]
MTRHHHLDASIERFDPITGNALPPPAAKPAQRQLTPGLPSYFSSPPARHDPRRQRVIPEGQASLQPQHEGPYFVRRQPAEGEDVEKKMRMREEMLRFQQIQQAERQQQREREREASFFVWGNEEDKKVSWMFEKGEEGGKAAAAAGRAAYTRDIEAQVKQARIDKLKAQYDRAVADQKEPDSGLFSGAQLPRRRAGANAVEAVPPGLHYNPITGGYEAVRDRPPVAPGGTGGDTGRFDLISNLRAGEGVETGMADDERPPAANNPRK